MVRDELAAPAIADELARGTALLRGAGVETPRLDAELLLAWVLGVPRMELVLAVRDPVSPDAAGAYAQLLARRAHGREPVAYLLGSKPFRRLSLTVDRRVLIPRPETELLVELAISSLTAGARVADVGTGSGAVALALADERPDLTVTGIDVSADALAVARLNASRLALDVRFVQADLLDREPYDAVVANLPYVALGAALEPEISLHEPAGALFAGADGLDAIRRLVAVLTRRADVSLVGLEIAFDQADAVAGLLAGAGFGDVWRIRDLAGHERVIAGRR